MTGPRLTKLRCCACRQQSEMMIRAPKIFVQRYRANGNVVYQTSRKNMCLECLTEFMNAIEHAEKDLKK